MKRAPPSAHSDRIFEPSGNRGANYARLPDGNLSYQFCVAKLSPWSLCCPANPGLPESSQIALFALAVATAGATVCLLFDWNRKVALYSSSFKSCPRITKETMHKASFLLLLVRVTGLEPAQPCDHKNLNLTRLPIPPHPHIVMQSSPIIIAYRPCFVKA